MNKPRIIVTRRLPEAVETRLESLFDVTLNPEDSALSRDDLVAAMQTADGVLATVTDRIDAEVLAAGGRRRAGIVANFAVGVSHVDLAAARREGVVVTNTPGVLTEATADIAMLLLLAVTRRAWECESLLRRGEWEGFRPTGLLGTGLQGKTIGIIGMGRIGQAMARRCHYGFGMNVIYYNRSPVAEPGVPAQARPSIDAVMAEADMISLHLPGGPENHKTISATRIAMMQPTAYLINTARGDVVDEDALVTALRDRKIAGAGLDVFYAEPHVPEALRALDNVALLPHLGSATLETRTAMGMLAVDNLVAHFGDGDYPARVV